MGLETFRPVSNFDSRYFVAKNYADDVALLFTVNDFVKDVPDDSKKGKHDSARGGLIVFHTVQDVHDGTPENAGAVEVNQSALSKDLGQYVGAGYVPVKLDKKRSRTGQGYFIFEQLDPSVLEGVAAWVESVEKGDVEVPEAPVIGDDLDSL